MYEQLEPAVSSRRICVTVSCNSYVYKSRHSFPLLFPPLARKIGSATRGVKVTDQICAFAINLKFREPWNRHLCMMINCCGVDTLVMFVPHRLVMQFRESRGDIRVKTVRSHKEYQYGADVYCISAVVSFN